MTDCTTMGSVRFDLGPKPLPRLWPILISQDATERSGGGIGGGKCSFSVHFQCNVPGFLKRRHLCRYQDHRALTVDKKLSDRMNFLDANLLRVGNGWNPCVLPWLCLMKGRISTITKKHNGHTRSVFVLITLLKKHRYFKIFSVVNQWYFIPHINYVL